MIAALTLSVLLTPPSDPDAVAMWVDDLGRLTPFGRTFDVYIQTGFDPDFSYPNGDPRRPYMIGCTRGNESPAFTLGWRTAKSASTTGTKTLGFSVLAQASIGTASKPTLTSGGCIWG
jgi:hypothetical protein